MNGPATTSRVAAKLTFHGVLRLVLPAMMVALVAILGTRTPLFREADGVTLTFMFFFLIGTGNWLAGRVAPKGFFEHWGSAGFAWMIVTGVSWHALLSNLVAAAILIAGGALASIRETEVHRSNASVVVLGVVVLAVLAGYWVTNHRIRWILMEVDSERTASSESLARILYPGLSFMRTAPQRSLIVAATICTLVAAVIFLTRSQQRAQPHGPADQPKSDQPSLTLQPTPPPQGHNKPAVPPPSGSSNSDDDDTPVILQAVLRLSQWSVVLREAFPPTIEISNTGSSSALNRHRHQVQIDWNPSSPWDRSGQSEVTWLCEAAYAGSVQVMTEAFGRYVERFDQPGGDSRARLHNSRDANGWQPTHYAAYRGNVEALRWLLNKGWPTHTKTGMVARNGEMLRGMTIDRHVTPLHLAVMMNHTECVQSLLSGADAPRSFADIANQRVPGPSPLNEGDIEGFTPLDYAYMLNKVDLVTILIAAGGRAKLEPIGEGTDFTGRLRFRKP